MVTSSAPGTLFLFGEHAVVYGEPAVACAIERRTAVTAEQRADSQIQITAPQLGFDGIQLELGNGEPSINVEPDRVREAGRYIVGAIDQIRELTESPATGFDITIESELPMGAGLGSSAAVTIATLDAAARECGRTLTADELAERGYQVEYQAQDGGASRTQTFCATMGGAVRVEGEAHESIPAPDLPFVIGYDGGGAPTGELVANVRALKDEYGFAAGTIAAIGDLTREGEVVLADGELSDLGRLMDFNHGLLAALGVSSRSLDEMAWASRLAGGAGAKLTGAGGGGCIVALDPEGTAQPALELTPECEWAFAAELTQTGIRRE